jgi:acetylornithine deacetylase/succinyl-diaminopimelate desuccinylase-like protein
MDAWDTLAARRLTDLVRFPTVAEESKFAGACPGWTLTRAETFRRAADYLREWLSPFASTVMLQDVIIDGQSLPNVWAHIPGRDSSRAVLLEGHYDVVALEGDFSPRLSAGERDLLGRGTTDMKGGLVAGILALEEMVRSGRPPRVDTYLLMTCEEEVLVAGLQEFLRHRLDWWDRLEFAICLEPTVEGDRFEIATQHPGDSSLLMSVPVPQAGTLDRWLELTIRTGETPHASREPAYFDPNYALLRVLSRLPAPTVAALHSDRPIDKEANALSAYACALIDATVGEDRLRAACRQGIDEVVAGLQDDGRREYARERLQLEITPVAGSRPGYDVVEFVQALVDLKQQVTGSLYTNALYARTPYVVAILDVRKGMARAKVDVRTDDHLFDDMARIAGPDRFPGWTISRWGDPGLEQPGIEDNASFRRFLDCCRRVFPRTVIAAHSGWTEAALLSKGLGVPVVIAGPGRTEWAHKKEERIALSDMRAVHSVLLDFLA